MDGLTETTNRELTMSRRFAAPPALVFKLWTEAEHIVRWWGCIGNTNTVADWKAAVGNAFRVVMTLEGGSTHVTVGEFVEVTPPKKLVFTWAWESGGMENADSVVTVTFEPDDDGTMLTLHQGVFADQEMRDLHGLGWTASFDRLEGYAVGAD